MGLNSSGSTFFYSSSNGFGSNFIAHIKESIEKFLTQKLKKELVKFYSDTNHHHQAVFRTHQSFLGGTSCWSSANFGKLFKSSL